MEARPELASDLSGRSARIGGAEGVLAIAFHAELICACLRHARGEELPRIPLRLLERAAKEDVRAEFASAEPALSSNVASNVDSEAVRLELARIGLALALSSPNLASTRDRS